MNELTVGGLAQELYMGYMAYCASRKVLAHPAIASVLARLEAENQGPAAVPTGRIRRANQSEIVYHLTWAVENIAKSAEYEATYDRLWLAGALLTLGDALQRVGYCDHAPDLEFVRHLRNGVAHGNNFDLRSGEPSRPAHFTGPDKVYSQDGSRLIPAPFFEITALAHGHEVLFGFVGPADVCDLLQFVSWRLIRIGNGDPPLPLWPQRP